MAHLPSHPDTHHDAGEMPDHRSTASRPWGTHVFGLVTIILVALFVVLHVTGTLGPGAH